MYGSLYLYLLTQALYSLVILCPGIHTFWKEVFHTLSCILKVYLDPDPLTALFGVPGVNIKFTVGKRPLLPFSYDVPFCLGGEMLPRSHIQDGWRTLCPVLNLGKTFA